MVKIPLSERGTEGLQQWNGMVSESYLSKLQWPGVYSIYDEMRRRDPTLRSIFNAVRLLGRQATWAVEPGGTSDADKRAETHLSSCLDDMSHTVGDFIDDALTMLPFGWADAEIVYKRRPDGRVGWRKFAPRRQSTLRRWKLDAAGGLQGWYQSAAPDYKEVFLPISKLLHFVAERDGNNPEGLSLLESAYEPWYFVKNLQIISGIGWQRAFVGLPVFEFEEKPTDADKATVKGIAEGLQVGSAQYVSVPPKVKFRLETVQNSSANSLLDTIRMYRVMMTQMVLADFIWLGAEGAGSWSLGSDKSQLFLMAVNGYLDRIAAVWNRHGVARLFGYTEWAGLERYPQIVHSDVRKFKLGELGSFIQQIAAYIPLHESDASWVRQQVGMPKASGAVLARGQNGPGGSAWAYPAEREPVDAAEGEREPGLVRLAEADYEREDERRKMEKGLADVVGTFFDAQQQRVTDVAERGANPGEDAEFWTLEQDAMREAVLQDLLKTVLDLTQMAIESAEADFAGGADWTLVNADAMKWARGYSYDLIKGITKTTRGAVRETVGGWIETGGTMEDLIDLLTPTFGPKRAEMIGTTEVTRAFDEANDRVRQQAGLPAAVVKAPAHVRCRCYTRPAFVNGQWAIVWNTVRDDDVCTQPLSMPWGEVAGCSGMDGLVVGGPDAWLGKPVSEVK